jgi:hypothetical protein
VALLADILARVRTEIGDVSKNFTFTGTGDGATTTFYLNTKPVELANLYVTVNGSAIAYPAGYSLESNTGLITFVTAPANNATISVHGTTVRYFLDSDLTTFINTAVTQHTHNRTDAYGSSVSLASIPAVEEYPLAILASIEALWALATDSAFDINITAPDGVTIPRSQRYAQLTGIIQQRTEQYKQLCSALNIGLWRIEMGALRRISKTTNKLIPIYMAQEIDDSRMPERVYIQNDLLGRTPTPTTVQTYDVLLYQGDSYYAEFDFPFNTTGITWKAQVRTYPNAPSLYATFTITTLSTSSTLSRIALSLTHSDTAYMPPRAFWDLQATSASNKDYEQTYIRGQVFTTQQVTLD